MSNIFNKTKFILIFCFFLSISGCGLYQKSDARKVPVNAKERAEQNVREGKGFSLMDIGKKGLLALMNLPLQIRFGEQVWIFLILPHLAMWIIQVGL